MTTSPIELSGLGFLGALRLSDSALPTGLFTQSHSLEAFVHAGRVGARPDVATLLEDILTEQVAPSDSVATAWAWRAAASGDVALIQQTDGLLHATKLCREMREGSARSGGRLLRLGSTLTGQRLLSELQQHVDNGETAGHYATVFGALCALMDIGLKPAVQMELYSFAASFLWAAMRLLRFDHMDAQRTLVRLEPLVLQLADTACERELTDVRSFGPLVEIMSMHHERGRIRLFSS